MLRSQWPDAGPLPVVCCDDASDPPVEQAVPLPPGVRVVHRTHPGGPGAARNPAWRASAADWVWFLDDDVLPEPGAVAAMCAAVASAAPDVGIIEGPIRAEAGPADQLAHPLIPRVPEGGACHRLTANIAYRRAALEAADGFDERFPVACEDFDLAFRVEDAGWRHAFAPGAAVRHAIPRAVSLPAWWRKRRAVREDVVRLYRRHPRRFGPPWVDRYGRLIHLRGRTPGPGSFLRFFVAEAVFDAVAARRWWRRPHHVAGWWVLALAVAAAAVRDYLTGRFEGSA